MGLDRCGYQQHRRSLEAGPDLREVLCSMVLALQEHGEGFPSGRPRGIAGWYSRWQSRFDQEPCPQQALRHFRISDAPHAQ
ncbi:unnamed protein product [Symbiodinium sp. CCMP2592]|nr:unnamed protein product [Symbiodinium sp. CCMP2592]